jgi:hypothetical protein
MTSQEEVTNAYELLGIHRASLAHYLRQKALLGILTFPHIIHGINDSRSNIRRIKNDLRQLGKEVDNHLNDEEISVSKIFTDGDILIRFLIERTGIIAPFMIFIVYLFSKMLFGNDISTNKSTSLATATPTPMILQLIEDVSLLPDDIILKQPTSIPTIAKPQPTEAPHRIEVNAPLSTPSFSNVADRPKKTQSTPSTAPSPQIVLSHEVLLTPTPIPTVSPSKPPIDLELVDIALNDESSFLLPQEFDIKLRNVGHQAIFIKQVLFVIQDFKPIPPLPLPPFPGGPVPVQSKYSVIIWPAHPPYLLSGPI